jgi:sec-independent protein translocase protein TatA
MLGLDNPLHILILLIVLLLLFGAKRLPDMGRSLGEGMRGFKESLSGTSSTPPAAAAAEAQQVAPAPPVVAAAAPAPVAVPVAQDPVQPGV